MPSLDGKSPDITALFILNRDLVSKWHAAFVHCAKAREKKLHAAFSTIKKQHAAWTQSSPVTDLPQARYAPALFPVFTYFKIPAKSTVPSETGNLATLEVSHHQKQEIVPMVGDPHNRDGSLAVIAATLQAFHLPLQTLHHGGGVSQRFKAMNNPYYLN
ncbi:hypothetical protein C8F04DRAFT_1194429 [Mycena alexandri]|uniref:Uncharacterized protein n=1 Tax=Mycena alexandri TaxID=1745969 RepID=A0AAD6WRP1_9AGAR|nr:hypothetical protein C8F04DRAFT_1194429 [Mycena alexandri]